MLEASSAMIVCVVLINAIIIPNWLLGILYIIQFTTKLHYIESYHLHSDSNGLHDVAFVEKPVIAIADFLSDMVLP